jgi:hypothetical protein
MVDRPSNAVQRDAQSLEVGTRVMVYQDWEGFYGKPAYVFKVGDEHFYKMEDISSLPPIPKGTIPEGESETKDDGIYKLLVCGVIDGLRFLSANETSHYQFNCNRIRRVDWNCCRKQIPERGIDLH